MSSRLLVLSSQLDPGPGPLEEIRRLIKAGVDWESFIGSSALEGVAPLVYRNLKPFAFLLPPVVVGRLRELYVMNSVRNIGLFRQLAPLLDALRTSGFTTALTKGARLAPSVYGDAGLRPFTDVDLFIHPDSWSALEGFLVERGFRKRSSVSAAWDPKDRRRGWLYSPYYSRGRLLLELHPNTLGLHAPSAAEDDFWEDRRDMALDGGTASVLSPEYELCYLCLHAQQHSYSRLIWLTDIAALSRKAGISWKKVAWICREEKITASVRHGLHLARLLWPDSVPEGVMDGLPVSSMENRMLRFFWPESRIVGRLPVPHFPFYMPTILSLLARKDIRLLGHAIGGVCFPPRWWMAHSYGVPERSAGMYLLYARRLFRPVWLAVKHVLRAA